MLSIAIKDQNMEKYPYVLGLKYAAFNIFAVCFVSSLCSLAYVLQSLTYYPESDNVGMLLVPVFLIGIVFPVILIISSSRYARKLSKNNKTRNYKLKVMLTSIALSLVCVILIPILLFTIVGFVLEIASPWL